jgi:tRNA A22 N-methylase
MVHRLSGRFAAAAQMVSKFNQAFMADIACETGLFTHLLVRNNLIPGTKRAIFADQNRHSLLEGIAKFRDIAGSNNNIQLLPRHGDGIQVLENGDATLVSILGVGTSKIQSILESRFVLDSKGISKLVLQPSPSSLIQLFRLRRFLYSNQIDVLTEKLVFESGFYYLTFAAEVSTKADYEKIRQMQDLIAKSDAVDFSNQDLYLGREIESDSIDTLRAYYSKWLSHIDEILQNCDKRTIPEEDARIQIHNQLQRILRNRLLNLHQNCKIQ